LNGSLGSICRACSRPRSTGSSWPVGTGGASDSTRPDPPPGRADLARAIHAAFASGLNLTTAVAGLTALAGALAVLVLLRRPTPPADRPAAAEPRLATTPATAA
jgi:hypothetical protein